MGVLISCLSLLTMFMNWSLKEGIAHHADVIGGNSRIRPPIGLLGKWPCFFSWAQPLQVQQMNQPFLSVSVLMNEERELMCFQKTAANKS